VIELILISLAASAASMTLGVSRIAQPLRDWAARQHEWLGHLAHCPYCLSHWLVFGFVLVYRPSLWWPVEVLAGVTIASASSWVILKFLDGLEGG